MSSRRSGALHLRQRRCRVQLSFRRDRAILDCAQPSGAAPKCLGVPADDGASERRLGFMASRPEPARSLLTRSLLVGGARLRARSRRRVAGTFPPHPVFLWCLRRCVVIPAVNVGLYRQRRRSRWQQQQQQQLHQLRIGSHCKCVRIPATSV